MSLRKRGYLIEANFNQFYRKKDQWTFMPKSDLKANPEIEDELYRMLKKSYAKIGGHKKIKKPSDFRDRKYLVFGTDVDKDPEADAFEILKKLPPGKKMTAGGTDAGPQGKAAFIKRQTGELKTPGFYAEVSGAIGHVLLKHGVKSIDDEAKVRKVLQKDIEWVGPHPEGKYPKNKGWYYRKIGGTKLLKILVGKPKV